MPCVRAVVFASTLTKTFDKPSLGRQHTLQPDMKLEMSDVGCLWCHWTRRRRLQARKLETRLSGTRMRCSYRTGQVQDNSVSSYEGGEHGHKEFTKTQEPRLAAISLSILLIMLGAQDNDPKRAGLCRTAPPDSLERRYTSTDYSYMQHRIYTILQTSIPPQEIFICPPGRRRLLQPRGTEYLLAIPGLDNLGRPSAELILARMSHQPGQGLPEVLRR